MQHDRVTNAVAWAQFLSPILRLVLRVIVQSRRCDCVFSHIDGRGFIVQASQ